ncbi:MAG: MoaD/ThiS family protein [Clostridia bacterium]|nr:MoaD/ThiS family protein [Clostridia bacterium]
MIRLVLPRDLAALLRLPDHELELPCAPTLGELLRSADEVAPGLLRFLCEADGALRPHLLAFVGEEDARKAGGLAAPLRDGDEVWILRAVSGG